MVAFPSLGKILVRFTHHVPRFTAFNGHKKTFPSTMEEKVDWNSADGFDRTSSTPCSPHWMSVKG